MLSGAIRRRNALILDSYIVFQFIHMQHQNTTRYVHNIDLFTHGPFASRPQTHSRGAPFGGALRAP